VGEVDHPLAPYQLEQLDRRHVDRLLQGAAQGHDAVVLVVVVLRPVGELAVATQKGGGASSRVSAGVHPCSMAAP